MSVGELVCRSAKQALDALESLLGEGKDYVFRGHDEPGWRLSHTFSRFRSVRPDLGGCDLDGLIEKFRVGLARVGVQPLPGDDRQDWMEYGRHYGLPMPCLDFSYSPYIALFFAYAGSGWEIDRRAGDYVEVNALNVAALGREWVRLRLRDEPDQDPEELYRRFRFPAPPLFQNGFPEHALQFIPFPSRHNARMQQQLGALLFDSLDYAALGLRDFQGFLEGVDEPDGPLVPPFGRPHALIKIYAPVASRGEILARLELMGVTGGRLFQDAHGAVIDAVNSYSYASRAYALRDVVSPPRREE